MPDIEPSQSTITRHNGQTMAMRLVRLTVAIVFLALVHLHAAATDVDSAARQDDGAFAALSKTYINDVRPLLIQFCLECHSADVHQGDVDLQRFATLDDVRAASSTWQNIERMIESGEMPPKDSLQPNAPQRRAILGWLRDYLKAEALAHAGDPGPVVLRRLNNAEYRHTIQDLTGVALDPTREFPSDSGSGEGFTNTGTSLVMSAALLGKYFDAAKMIAEHAVLLPNGFRFSSHTTRRDWTNEIIEKIRAFYGEFVETVELGTGAEVGNVNVHGNTRIGQVGRLPLEKYLAATLTEREALITKRKTIGEVANAYHLNGKYLAQLWECLSASEPSLLLSGLCARWRTAGPHESAALATEIGASQRGLWVFGPVGLIGRRDGPTRWLEPVNPVVAEHEIRFEVPPPADGEQRKEFVLSLVASDAGDGADEDFIVWHRPRLVRAGRPDLLLYDIDHDQIQVRTVDAKGAVGQARPAVFGQHPRGETVDSASLCVQAPAVIQIVVSAELAKEFVFVTTATLASDMATAGSVQVDVLSGVPASVPRLAPSEITVKYSQVKQVYSDQRTTSFSRPTLVAKNSVVRKRIESGMDEYRQLFPAALCYSQIVPIDEVLTTTLFYREDDHLVRLMLDEAQRCQLDRLWDELHFVSQSPLLHLTAVEMLLETYLGNGLNDRSQYDAIEPLRKPFADKATEYRRAMLQAEPRQIDALLEFAANAYRHELTDVEADELRALYVQLRQQELSHEAAYRLTLARILVAAPFLYRLEAAPTTSTAEVSNWEIASRLSYFLWSTQPDDELRRLAKTIALQSPEMLTSQSERMLRDARVRGLATEFACQWLRIYEFDLMEEKSAKLFPEFSTLRGDMYEESIRFFTDLFQRDASLLSLLDADHTFVNDRLAHFYGIEGVAGANWQRVEGMQRLGRGGILGLATTLAKQSGASRTSPILRGNWVNEVLLGERLPRPPKDVPQLPPEKNETDGLSVRQLVSNHTRDARCASCHQKIDPFGFALEGFDSIGGRREYDLAGRPIDTEAQLPDGQKIHDLTGLRDYLLEKRRSDFVRQFCRKLLGYALGRAVQLSDEPLLNEMQHQLETREYRLSVAVGAIVRSRQFREIRGTETARCESN
jgi:hypothetical protein